MAYALFAVTLMALDYRGQYVDRFRTLAGQLIEPMVLLIDLPFHGADRFNEFWARRVELVDRVRRLEREAVERRAALGELHDLNAENRNLRSLLEAGQRMELEYLAAELASIDLDPFAHRIVVKRGRVDEVVVGMPVIDDRGVLGQVEDVLRSTSRVILLTDPDHALPVQVLPAGERTIAYGTGRVDRLRLTDLPMNTAVQVDDLVVTSGLGGRFPAGLPVGRVVALERPPGEPFATASIEPLSAMDRNRLVLIVEVESAESAEAGAADPAPGQEVESAPSLDGQSGRSRGDSNDEDIDESDGDAASRELPAAEATTADSDPPPADDAGGGT